MSLAARGRKQKQSSIIKSSEKRRGFKHTETALAKMRTPRSEEFKEKMCKAATGLKWWNNGIINKRSRNCPEGFIVGRLWNSTHNTRWWTNGIINKKSQHCPAEGFYIGRTIKSKTT